MSCKEKATHRNTIFNQGKKMLKVARESTKIIMKLLNNEIDIPKGKEEES